MTVTVIKSLRSKGFVPKGPDPINGKGSYVNPKTGRVYHVDAKHPVGKNPHVGIKRARGKRGKRGQEKPGEKTKDKDISDDNPDSGQSTK